MTFYLITTVKDHLKNKKKILDRIMNNGSEWDTGTGNPISKTDFTSRQTRAEMTSFLAHGNSFSSGTVGMITNWFTFSLSVRDRERYYKDIRRKFDPAPRVSKTVSEVHVPDYWFNQYNPNSNSEHPFHCHWDDECHNNLTSIYYVELEDKSLRTIVTHPLTKKEIAPPVKEGQILTFDATLWHRSPQNSTDTRKTVVSFNTNFYK